MSYISRDLKGDEYSFPNKIKLRCFVPTFFDDDVHIFGCIKCGAANFTLHFDKLRP